MQEIAAVLATLMSGDNVQRKNAEAYYENQLSVNLIPTLESLVAVLASPIWDRVVRSMAGVLLRRAIERNSEDIPADSASGMKAALIQIWKSELDTTLLKRLSHVLAQCAAENSWGELLPLIINHASSNASKPLLISSLGLIEIVADYCPDDISTNLATVGNFLATMIAHADEGVKVACARSVGACIVAIEDDTARNTFKPALQPIVSILGAALSRGDESDAGSILESLIAVAQIQPIFFKGAIDNVISAMMTVASSESLEFQTRSLAVELMITFTETAPALARRCSGLVEGLMPLCMSIALEVDDDQDEWSREKYTEEPSDENNCVGEEAIDRAAAGMGGRVVAPRLLSIVQQYSVSGDWRHRRAAIAGLSRLAEGATDQFKQYLNKAVPLLSSALSDPSPRVKFEAIHTIGRLASLFPSSVAELVETFLPPLTQLLGDAAACDKIRGHAASAMINLVNPENCEAEALTRHLEPLLTALVVCLQSAAVEVQPHCLVLLGCAAQVAEEAFLPYYPSFMPGIKSILRTATAPDMSQLRGRAMECIGLIGEAVGAEIFAGDALEVMQLLIEAMGHDDDVTFDYILPACGRISKALQRHFEPFLPVVMSAVLAGATQDIKFSMVDADEEDVDGEVVHDDETGTESTVISLGAGVCKRVTMNTHAVQQKNQAARMLYEFGSSMRGHLKSYLAPSAAALLVMITDRHSADMRSSAILALAKIFDAYVHAAQMGYISAADLNSMLAQCIAKLLESLKGENNSTARACAAESMRDVLAACYSSGAEQPDGKYHSFVCAPAEAMALTITKELLKRSKECLGRRAEKEAAFLKNEGLDADDKEGLSEELEEDEELLTNLVDALGQLLKLFSVSFMPVFDSMIVPMFAPYLAAEQPTALQIIAVCLIDDAIEFGGEAAMKYVPHALTSFCRGMRSDDSVLRQSSVYGMAQSARMAPQAIGPILETLMPQLVTLISDPTAGDEENVGVTENGLFALGTILHNPAYRTHSWGQVLPGVVGSIWLKGMPLRADEQEAKMSNSQLCDLAEKGEEAVLGSNYCNLPELLRIFSEVLLATSPSLVKDNETVHTLAHPETVQRMRTLSRQLLQSCSADVIKHAYSNLTTAQQEALR